MLTLRITWLRVLLGGTGLVLGGLLVAWIGLFNIGATGGHWAATDWFLHWVMRSSVRTYSLAAPMPPSLDDIALKARGAGHYAAGCAPCHGAPGEPQNPIVQRSTPPPPDFSEGIAEWTPRELFRIVQHGVRYTGMPGWVEPARHDEIWAVVAFLEAMPALTPPEYRRLAAGELAAAPPRPLPATVATGEALLADCARCHNRDGQGRDGAAFPVIAGLSEAYLLQSLRDYGDGSRPSGLMQLPASRLDEAGRLALARHYAGQPRAPVAQSFAPELLELGGRIARDGLPEAQVPACLSCHGTAARARNPAWPQLDGQHAAYLEGQLGLWREGLRNNEVMRTVADRLTAEQARAVAAWFAAQR